MMAVNAALPYAGSAAVDTARGVRSLRKISTCMRRYEGTRNVGTNTHCRVRSVLADGPTANTLSGVPGTERTPNVTATIKSSMPNAFHNAIQIGRAEPDAAIAASGSASAQVITSPQPADGANGAGAELVPATSCP